MVNGSKSGISDQQAGMELTREANKVDDSRLADLIARREAIENKVKNSGRLRRFGTDIRLMFSLISDYAKGRYREIPWKSIAAIAGALLYVLNPLDLIPDLILGFGLLDDASVLIACLSLVESDLMRYAAWKEQNAERVSNERSALPNE